MATTQVTIRRLVSYGDIEVVNNVQNVVDRAAMVTEVEEDGQTVGLHIFHPSIINILRHIPYAETLTMGHWSWPPPPVP